MSKIFSVYSDNVDRVWYQSSNIKYSECIDKEGEMKTLKVVFNNGTQYQYNNVDVNHYLLFREDVSQGKALNKFIKGKEYEYQKLEDADMDKLEKELDFRIEGGHYVTYDGEVLTVKNNKDVVLFNKEIKLTEEAFKAVCEIIKSLGHDVRVKGGDRFYLLNEDTVVDYNDRS